MSRDGFVKAQSDNLPKVSVLMVTEFFASSECFNAAETRGVKLHKSQRENYGDSAIGYVELKREGSLCHVRGRVCPEHRVRSKPYTVECFVNEEDEEVTKVGCEDCAASAGGCKHAVAFLMWLHRRSEEPEPTATVCYWKKSVLSQVGSSVKFATTKDMKSPSTEYTFGDTENFYRRVIEQLAESQCVTQISAHTGLRIYDRVSMHQLILSFVKTDQFHVDDFLEFASTTMTVDECQNVANNTQSQSECRLWSEMRYCRITASKIHEISHCNTEKGVLVEQLIGTSKVKHTEAMDRGHSVKNCGLILDPSFPVLGASPDAIGADFVVEVKCPTSIKTELNYIKDGKINNRYLAQIQLQMFMCKLEKGYFCMAKHDFETTKNMEIILVEYNEGFIMDLINRSMLFWKKNIFPILINSAK
ncbi:hypothetical protein RI129_011221 [Pyrocoelia pectoralis]|uniref:YqaJ viral recombinase domain-containing protein n=1 Tax=Pyrocoelia pectoralis TaxID=417401 RepID=A0AAN7V0L3_9COLE